MWYFVSAGVPQGSVLGPLLFLVYINDITSVVQHSKVRLYADDTCLYNIVKDPAVTADEINEDLKNISEWAKKWLIDFNALKTKSLIISNKKTTHHPNVLFNDIVIEEVTSHKHLGMTISSTLKWKTHFDGIISKSRKRLQTLKYIKYKVSRKTLEILYNMFVLPILDYGDALYAGSYELELDDLDKIHEDAMRIVTGGISRCNRAALYEETKWQTLNCRREEHVISIMFKIVNGLAPVSILETFAKLNAKKEHSMRLRGANNIAVPLAKREQYKRSFFPYAIKKWNDSDRDMKSVATLNELKQEFKKHRENPPMIYYYGKRSESIHHARMRLGCSDLNHHLCNVMHVIDSAKCNCGFHKETVTHFLIDCPLYEEYRRDLFFRVSALSNFTVKTMLFGDNTLKLEENIKIFSYVHEFIFSTGRFTELK